MLYYCGFSLSTVWCFLTVQKPRPLDPVQDEEYMKRIYGKALYHKQRNAQKEACERYHGSPKSKLPRSPVKLSRAIVTGNEIKVFLLLNWIYHLSKSFCISSQSFYVQIQLVLINSAIILTMYIEVFGQSLCKSSCIYCHIYFANVVRNNWKRNDKLSNYGTLSKPFLVCRKSQLMWLPSERNSLDIRF